MSPRESEPGRWNLDRLVADAEDRDLAEAGLAIWAGDLDAQD